MSKEVVSVAKERRVSADAEVVLSTGVRVHVKPVSASLLTESMGRIPRPEVPMFYDEDRGKEIPNPGHPDYLAALDDRETEQGSVAMDAMVMFGVELLDGIPDDGEWERKLKFLEKIGSIDLSEYDLDDDLEREFVYKKYIAVSSADIALIREASGVVKEEDLEQAEDSFPGTEG